MTDVEVRAPETADSGWAPHDALIDDDAGGVRRLSEKRDVRSVLGVSVEDIPVESAGAPVFGLDGPFEHEVALPAGNQRCHGSGWDRVVGAEPACRQDDGDQSHSYYGEHRLRHWFHRSLRWDNADYGFSYGESHVERNGSGRRVSSRATRVGTALLRGKCGIKHWPARSISSRGMGLPRTCRSSAIDFEAPRRRRRSGPRTSSSETIAGSRASRIRTTWRSYMRSKPRVASGGRWSMPTASIQIQRSAPSSARFGS